MSPEEALTYIACPTGAGGANVAERHARVDALSEAEAKDVLKRCIAMADAARPITLHAVVDGFMP